MRRGKLGFTLIEVAIFLAITGLLFFGITIGVQNSIYQQRKNDSVQSFMEFLREVYSEVLNVQNDADNGGKSSQAIYGKLVVFGENIDLAGNSAKTNEIFTYSVIGDIKDVESESALNMLSTKLNASVIMQDEKGSKKFAGFADSYEPKWSAQIEKIDYQPFTGMLLIVRHPNSGIVNTYFTNDVEQINEDLKSGKQVNIFKNVEGYRTETVNFCVNANPGNKNELRSNVRIAANARNASGIELIPEEEGVCNKK